MPLFAPEPKAAPVPLRDDAGAPRPRCCGECGAVLARAPGKRNIFCAKACRVAYANRMTVRGRQLTALAMADRMTRSGTRGKPEARKAGAEASRRYRQLIDKFAAEDRDAGRISAVDYCAARQRLGYEG
jgi:hypothetical protein